MSNNNFKPPADLPESREYVDQSNFEFSEYLTFDDWLDEEDPTSNASGSTNQNPVHQANEVSVFGGSESHVEGSSSSKQKFLLSQFFFFFFFFSTNMALHTTVIEYKHYYSSFIISLNIILSSGLCMDVS